MVLCCVVLCHTRRPPKRLLALVLLLRVVVSITSGGAVHSCVSGVEETEGEGGYYFISGMTSFCILVHLWVLIPDLLLL